MALFKSVVPPEVTSLELEFMKSINSEVKMVGDDFINFSYISLAPEANQYQPNFCQSNVASKIAKDGGYCVSGWCIWKSPVLLEAQYHHVWMSPEGEIFDITPKDDKAQCILFVFDPKREYKGYPIQHKRKILVDIPEVRKMIKFQDRIYKIQREYWVAYENQTQPLPAKIMKELYSSIKKLGLVTHQIENFLRISSEKK